MHRVLIAFLALAAFVAPARAEVTTRSSDGFVLSFSAPARMDPDDFTGSVERVSAWWDSGHTYSGSANNLSLTLDLGGCWCEALADGTTFEHAKVRSVSPTEVVFDAPLGPLSGRATRAELTMRWIASEQGVTPIWSFAVEGTGLGAMADGVNAVMDAAFRRWVAHLESSAGS